MSFGQGIQMVVTVKNGGAKSIDNSITLPEGEIVFPIDAFKSIEYRKVEPIIDGLRKVDMGLSVQWANINFGAKDSTQVGVQMTFDDQSQVSFSWGEHWRVPTLTEIEELRSCKWNTVYDNKGDVSGFKVFSKNEKDSLFFPVTSGYTKKGISGFFSKTNNYYWSSNKYSTLQLNADDSNVQTLIRPFNTTDVETYQIAVRPVYAEQTSTPKTVNLSSTSNVSGSSATVIVSFSGDYSDITRYGIRGTSALEKENLGSPAESETFSWTNLAPGTYSYQPYAYIGDKEFTVESKSFIIEDVSVVDTDTLVVNEKFPVAEKVDMGLSVLWSSWNMGASKIGDYGKLIGWGDSTGELEQGNDARYGVNQWDSINIAGSDYDIAHVQWGNSWRLPTKAELTELVTKCQYEKVSNYVVDGVGTGISGWVFYEAGKEKGKGNQIFLPLSGIRNANQYGIEENEMIQGRNTTATYWTSEFSTYEKRAWAKQMSHPTGDFERLNKSLHLCIRPVCDLAKIDEPVTSDTLFKSKEAGTVLKDGVNLGLPSGKRWAKWNIGANKETDYGNYYAWGDTLSRSAYTKASYAENVAIYDGVDGTQIGDLAANQDAAAKIWKNGWRMPTMDEYGELERFTTQSWTYINGVPGLKFTSTVSGYEDKYIFFPASGYMDNSDAKLFTTFGYYWTSSYFYVNNENDRKERAQDVRFGENYNFAYPGWKRYCGCSVRPIHD